MSFFQNLDAADFRPKSIADIRQYLDENVDIGIDVTSKAWGVKSPKGGGAVWLSEVFPEYFGNSQANPSSEGPGIATEHALRQGMRSGRAENKKTRSQRIEEYRQLVEQELPLPEGGAFVANETVEIDANYILPHPQDRGCDWGLC